MTKHFVLWVWAMGSH